MDWFVERKEGSKNRHCVCPQTEASEHRGGAERSPCSAAEMVARTDRGFGQRTLFLEANTENLDHTALWDEERP